MSTLYYLLTAAAPPEVWPRPAPTRARAPTPAKAARLCACSRCSHPIAPQRPRARSACLAASQRPRPTGPARQRPAASQHARSRRPRPAASRRPWQIGSARPRSRHGPRPCWPWAGHRCRPALDLEFQVRTSGGEKPENGARDFFLGDKGVIWSFHGGSIWLLTEETNRLDGSAR